VSILLNLPDIYKQAVGACNLTYAVCVIDINIKKKRSVLIFIV